MELKVKHASRPHQLPLSIYDVQAEHICAPPAQSVPRPFLPPVYIANPLEQPFLVSKTGSTINANSLFTDWEKLDGVRINFDDESDPRGTIRLVGTPKSGPDVTFMTSAYGLLPSSYTKTYYEMLNFTIDGAWASYSAQLLFDEGYNCDGKCCLMLSVGGNRSPIEYTAMLRNKTTDETITVTGSSIAYSVTGGVHTTQLAIYYDRYDWPMRGDGKGYIKLVETPSEWEE